MASLMTMRNTCTRVSSVMRYCAVTKRHNGFWAALAKGTPQESKDQIAKYLQADAWATPLEKQKALEESGKPQEEFSKLGFWAGLRQIYQEGKQQALEDANSKLELPKATDSRTDRRRVLDDYDIIPGSEEFKQFYAGHKQSELALETGVPDECIDDPSLHIAMMKFNRLKEFYKINTEEEEKVFVDKFYISAGVQTLEAAYQGVMPEHTFTELPIIKEPPADGHH